VKIGRHGLTFAHFSQYDEGNGVRRRIISIKTLISERHTPKYKKER